MLPESSTPTLIRPADQSSLLPRTLLGGLCQRRVCVLPTWRGWIVLLLVVSLLVTVACRHLCDFLTVNDSIPGGVLVVEGWVSSDVMRAAVAESHRHSYAAIYVTGETIEEDDPRYPAYHNFAFYTADRLVQMGLAPGSVHTAPAPAVGRDRTYTMAVTLKQRLEADGVSTAQINVFSSGPHSRRSRLLYERAFGSHSRIGMVGVAPGDFDSQHWWKSSVGVRVVVGELIAYVYARLLFYPGVK